MKTKKNGITEYFKNVELEEAYDGYFCSVPEAITIGIIGSMCGLKNAKQIQQWASNDRVSEFLKEKFGINHVPCYYWFICLLKLIKTESLNLNMFRKAALNIIKLFKERTGTKRALSNIMLDCLIDSRHIAWVVGQN